MDVELCTPDPRLIRVDENEILRLLVRSENVPDRHTRELVRQYTARCKASATPKAGYIRREVVQITSRESLDFGETSFNVGRIIAGKLKKASSVAIFAVTAGPGPESLARELMKQGSYLEGYLADLIGTAIVESAADQIHRRIKSEAAARQMRVTNRYSPGYCSWNVNEQQKLFQLLPPGPCGIELGESSLMTPIKSVSGIIGIGQGVTFSDNSCEACPMPDCMFRKS